MRLDHVNFFSAVTGLTKIHETKCVVYTKKNEKKTKYAVN